MRIGIDLGGTKIKAIAFDDCDSECFRRRVATPRGSYQRTIEAITNLVVEAEARVGGACTVGVGIPGTVSPATSLIKNANSTWLIGRRFDHDLETALQRPVKLANDANCFALSEASDGAGADATSVFGVILGTGVGGGFVLDGQLLGGANAIAGEWGHNPIP
jgi:fructokinase